MILYYKLMYLLFGWEYWMFPFGFSFIVRRARKHPSGRLYAKAYGDTIWLDVPRYRSNKPEDRPWKYVGKKEEV